MCEGLRVVDGRETSESARAATVRPAPRGAAASGGAAPSAGAGGLLAPPAIASGGARGCGWAWSAIGATGRCDGVRPGWRPRARRARPGARTPPVSACGSARRRVVGHGRRLGVLRARRPARPPLVRGGRGLRALALGRRGGRAVRAGPSVCDLRTPGGRGDTGRGGGRRMRGALLDRLRRGVVRRGAMLHLVVDLDRAAGRDRRGAHDRGDLAGGGGRDAAAGHRRRAAAGRAGRGPAGGAAEADQLRREGERAEAGGERRERAPHAAQGAAVLACSRRTSACACAPARRP